MGFPRIQDIFPPKTITNKQLTCPYPPELLKEYYFAILQFNRSEVENRRDKNAQ
jgi:hypothetical protein